METARKVVRTFMPNFKDAILVLVGTTSGLMNLSPIMSAVMAMAPALMQGGLMVKNIVPRQTIPALLTTLPWAFTTLLWAQYQLYYQIFGDKSLLFSLLAVSFMPMLYYAYSKYYNVLQPMDDQQSVTLTFRIW